MGGPVVKIPPANTGDSGSIPGLGRSPEIGNGNPLQYSCLENSMDREAWWTIVHGAIKSWTRLFSQHSDKGHVHISTPLANLFSRHVLPFSEAKVQSLYGNTITQNLWDTVKAVLREKFITIQSYLKK